MVKNSGRKQMLTKIKSQLKKRVIIALIFLLAAGLAGWQLFFKKEAEEPEYQTAVVERGMIIDSVSASGQVLAVNVMSANTQASGTVKTVFVKDGDEVKEGEKILEIDLDFQGEQKNAQVWSSYLAAKSALETAKANQYTLQAEMFNQWDDFKALAENGTYSYADGSPNLENRTLPEFLIAEREWLAAEAKYKNQEQAIAQAQANVNSSWLSYQLASPVITAPTAGVITSLLFTEGMSIGTLDTGSTTSNQKIAAIRTEGLPVVSVNLSEIDVAKVEPGQKATLTLDSLPEKTFTGEVAGVDRIGETASGVTQYPAIIQLETAAVEILPNMTVTANIVIARKDNVLLVPSGAVKTQGGQNLVSVLKNGQSQLVPVEIGLTSDTQTEIVSGLDEGDLVITGTVSAGSLQENGTSPFGGMGGMIRMVR